MSHMLDLDLPERPNKFQSVSEFRLESKIGEGSYAKVYRALHVPSQKFYAIKMINLSSMSKGDLENIQKELQIHSSIDSPSVVRLFDFFIESGKLHMVLELALNGNLYLYMYQHFQLPLATALDFWLQVLRAIGHLHSKFIYMRDLKPENVLVDEELRVKLCDFGWASRLEDIEYRRLSGGTYIYMSPENLKGELQGLKSDVWSLGVLLYELTHYREPFCIGISAEEQLEYIMSGKLEYKEDFNEDVRELIETMLEIDPERRPSVEDLQASSLLGKVEAIAKKTKNGKFKILGF